MCQKPDLVSSIMLVHLPLCLTLISAPPPPPPPSNHYSSHIRECPKTTCFEERKGEWSRGPFAAYQPNAFPLGQTGSPIQVSGIDRGFIRILQCRYRTISFHCFRFQLSLLPPPPPPLIRVRTCMYLSSAFLCDCTVVCRRFSAVQC